MESTKEVITSDHRLAGLQHWLQHDCQLGSYRLQALAGDASMRRYFRVYASNQTMIAMDAPPPNENCQPFVAIAVALQGMSLPAPVIYDKDIERGYLLITDFGDDTLLKCLTLENADTIYKSALDNLAVMQSCRHVPGWYLSEFGADWMLREWQWFKEWVLDKWLGVDFVSVEASLDQCMEQIIVSATSQPQVFMHRDYHSANLMLLPDKKVGILDFQDAFIGPVTYDLVSLLRDCYIGWQPEQVMHWMNYYFDQLVEKGVLKTTDQERFIRWFDWMGLQRHLKALMTFARKAMRDQQPMYLQHVPRTLNYLLHESGGYSEMQPLHEFIRTLVQSANKRMQTACER